MLFILQSIDLLKLRFIIINLKLAQIISLMFKKSIQLILLFSLFALQIKAQSQQITTSAEIELALRKLNTVGSVLYVAAHPDDENTNLLAYFANEQLLKT